MVSSHGQINNIKEIVKTFDYFDGAVWLVNYNNDNYNDDDGVYELLSKHKKQGRILKAPWVNLHDLSMDLWLKCGVIKQNDFFLNIDAQELPKKEFLDKLDYYCDLMDKNGIGALGWNRPYFIRYDEQQLLQGGHTHCWVGPIKGTFLNIVDESKVVYQGEEGVHFGDFLFNKKKFDDTMLLHAARYQICYEVGNETANQFGKFGNEAVQHHEKLRQQLRRYLQDELNLNISNFNDLIAFFKQDKSKYPAQFIEWTENDDALKTVFRYYVLGQTRQEILKQRQNWSFREYLRTGDVEQTDSKYIGLRNLYNQQAGLPME